MIVDSVRDPNDVFCSAFEGAFQAVAAINVLYALCLQRRWGADHMRELEASLQEVDPAFVFHSFDVPEELDRDADLREDVALEGALHRDVLEREEDASL